MDEYKTPYFVLFNGISDIVKQMEHAGLSASDSKTRDEYESFIIALRKLQLDSEDNFIGNQT